MTGAEEFFDRLLGLALGVLIGMVIILVIILMPDRRRPKERAFRFPPRGPPPAPAAEHGLTEAEAAADHAGSSGAGDVA